MDRTAPRIEMLSLTGLLPYARNARTHSAQQVAQIADSIREFGFTNPVLVDAAGGIIAGHGRVMAARQLGMTQVPCLRLTHLTDAQKRAYVIADNQLALNAGWDADLLAQELASLEESGYEIALTGLSEQDVAALYANCNADLVTQQVTRLDERAPLICPHCGKDVRHAAD